MRLNCYKELPRVLHCHLLDPNYHESNNYQQHASFSSPSLFWFGAVVRSGFKRSIRENIGKVRSSIWREKNKNTCYPTLSITKGTWQALGLDLWGRGWGTRFCEMTRGWRCHDMTFGSDKLEIDSSYDSLREETIFNFDFRLKGGRGTHIRQYQGILWRGCVICAFGSASIFLPEDRKRRYFEKTKKTFNFRENV